MLVYIKWHCYVGRLISALRNHAIICYEMFYVVSRLQQSYTADVFSTCALSIPYIVRSDLGFGSILCKRIRFRKIQIVPRLGSVRLEIEERL